jgi:hypothetical protein
MKRGVLGWLVGIFLLAAMVLLIGFNLTKPRILVLHSGERSSGWDQRIDDGIRTALGRNRRPVSVHWYYLGLERFPLEDERQDAATQARRAIEQLRPHVVLAVDDEAQAYVARYYAVPAGSAQAAEPSTRIVYAANRRPTVELWLRQRGQRQRRARAAAAGGHARNPADAAQRPASAAGGNRPGRSHRRRADAAGAGLRLEPAHPRSLGFRRPSPPRCSVRGAELFARRTTVQSHHEQRSKSAPSVGHRKNPKWRASSRSASRFPLPKSIGTSRIRSRRSSPRSTRSPRSAASSSPISVGSSIVSKCGSGDMAPPSHITWLTRSSRPPAGSMS